MDELRTLADLDQALAPGKGKVVLYKHSTQCGICDGAIEEIQEFLETRPGVGSFYYLDLLAHRDVSNAIAERLGVKHESPQAIVLSDGKVDGLVAKVGKQPLVDTLPGPSIQDGHPARERSGDALDVTGHEPPSQILQLRSRGKGLIDAHKISNPAFLRGFSAHRIRPSL